MLNHYTTWESMLTGRSWDRWNMGGSSVCVFVCSFLVGWVGGVVLSGKERDGEQAAASADQASLDRRGGGRT